MTAPPAGRGKKGLRDALAAEASAEVGRLAAEAARALGCDGGLEAAEAVIRAGMLKLGGGMLGQLLAADPGYRGLRVECGQGHGAEFVSYRDKTFDTVPGPVTVSRAWYHCAACGRGLPPRDAGLGVAGTSMSQGLAAMNDKVAAAGPFAKAAGLLADLAGVHLTAKRVERSAEASGAAKAAADRSRAKAITTRRLVPLPPSPLPGKLYAAIDGTGVPVTAKEAAGRDGVVATTSPSHRCPAARCLVERSTAGRANIRLARIDPPIAPAACAARATSRPARRPG